MIGGMATTYAAIVKMEWINTHSKGTRIIMIDPEREYRELSQKFNRRRSTSPEGKEKI